MKITYTLNGIIFIEAEVNSYFSQVIDAITKKRREAETKYLLALMKAAKPIQLKPKKATRDILNSLEKGTF